MAKMGRPPVKKPKACSLGVAVSAEEARRVQVEAKRAGVSVSGYIRRKLGLEDEHRGPRRGTRR